MEKDEEREMDGGTRQGEEGQNPRRTSPEREPREGERPEDDPSRRKGEERPGQNPRQGSKPGGPSPSPDR